jgi:hypothetical protein
MISLNEKGHAVESWDNLPKELQPFPCQIAGVQSKARCVSSRSREAGRQTAPNRVGDTHHDNRNCTIDASNGNDRFGASGGENVNLQLKQLDCQINEPFLSSCGPSVQHH